MSHGGSCTLHTAPRDKMRVSLITVFCGCFAIGGKEGTYKPYYSPRHLNNHPSLPTHHHTVLRLPHHRLQVTDPSTAQSTVSKKVRSGLLSMRSKWGL